MGPDEPLRWWSLQHLTINSLDGDRRLRVKRTETASAQWAAVDHAKGVAW